MNTVIELRIVKKTDDLASLVFDINQAVWDEANEMSTYDVGSLQNYLEKQDTVFISCYENKCDVRTLLGFASARIEHKPYQNEKWLYIDEVDVCADKRRLGAGTAVMQKLFEIAHEEDCEEVWLGAEKSNAAAIRFYQSLDPDDVTDVIGYTFDLEEIHNE